MDLIVHGLILQFSSTGDGVLVDFGDTVIQPIQKMIILQFWLQRHGVNPQLFVLFHSCYSAFGYINSTVEAQQSETQSLLTNACVIPN
jgi:hypothetical protein